MTSIYGDNGNRWWVGQNVGETGSQSTVFGDASLAALNPSTPSGYESLPSGDAADDAQFAAAAAKNKGSKSPVTISVENVQWYNIQGPYTTQALANAAISGIEAATPQTGVLGQTAKDDAGNPLGTAAAAATTFSSWETALQGLIQGLTGTNTWIRIAKVVAGGTILMVGLAKLTGADKAVGGIAAKAVKVAPLL